MSDSPRVRFPRLDGSKQPARTTAGRVKPDRNPHVAIREVFRDATLQVNTAQQFHGSTDRYGDLQVIMSAALRVIDNVKLLLGVEEECQQ